MSTSSSSPNKGLTGRPVKGVTNYTIGKRPHRTDGTSRTDEPFLKDGIHITLRAEKGLTNPKFLVTPFRFQCPPLNQFDRPLSVPWPVFETLSADERSRPQGAALRQWTFDTLFVWDHEPFVVWTGSSAKKPNAANGIFEPQEFIAELDTIAEKNVIFRLAVSQPSVWGATALVNSLAVITAVQPTQKAGEVGTEYLTITFQQFRDLTVGNRRRHSASKGAHSYSVQQGDTLHEIARKQLGHPSEWRRIAAVNGITNVGANDAAALAAWLKAHHRTTLKIPAQKKAEHRPKGKSPETGIKF